MDAVTMVTELRSKGIKLGVNGPNLKVYSRNPLTDEQRAFLKANKSQLLPVVEKLWKPAQIIDFMTGCDVLPDDLPFLQQYLPSERGPRLVAMQEYRQIWEQAAAAEPLPQKKENAGRKAANTWLRSGNVEEQ